eukprot:g34194.t1
MCSQDDGIQRHVFAQIGVPVFQVKGSMHQSQGELILGWLPAWDTVTPGTRSYGHKWQLSCEVTAEKAKNAKMPPQCFEDGARG